MREGGVEGNDSRRCGDGDRRRNIIYNQLQECIYIPAMYLPPVITVLFEFLALLLICVVKTYTIASLFFHYCFTELEVCMRCLEHPRF